jgi:hypothetical protein
MVRTRVGTLRFVIAPRARRNDGNPIREPLAGQRSFTTALKGRIHDRFRLSAKTANSPLAAKGPSIHDEKL